MQALRYKGKGKVQYLL